MPAPYQVRGDPVSSTGQAVLFATLPCHSGSVTIQVVFLTSMDRIDRMLNVKDSWMPAPYQVRGDPVSSTGQAVLFATLPCHSGSVTIQVVFLTSMDRIDRMLNVKDSWMPAPCPARGDPVSSTGQAVHFATLPCHSGSVTIQVVFLTSMDRIDRMLNVKDSWMPAPCPARGDPVSSTGQAVLFATLPCHSGSVTIQVVFLTSMDRIDRILNGKDSWMPAPCPARGRQFFRGNDGVVWE